MCRATPGNLLTAPHRAAPLLAEPAELPNMIGLKGGNGKLSSI